MSDASITPPPSAPPRSPPGGPAIPVVLDSPSITTSHTAEPFAPMTHQMWPSFSLRRVWIHLLCFDPDPYLSLEHGLVTQSTVCTAARVRIVKYESNHVAPRLKTHDPLEMPQPFRTRSVMERLKRPRHQGTPALLPLTSIAHDAHGRGRKYQNALPQQRELPEDEDLFSKELDELGHAASRVGDLRT